MLPAELLASTGVTTCRIVTDPRLSAQVLVDLNDKDTITLDRGRTLTLGAPGITVAATTLIDAGPRTIKLPLKVYGSQVDAERTIAGIARALLSPAPRWLLWRQAPDAQPLWFRLLPRGTAGELDLSMVPLDGAAKAWRWDLELQAEAFAYGARVSETVHMRYRYWNGTADVDDVSKLLAPVKGDAPTRCRIEIAPDATMGGWSPWLNVAAVPRGSWSTGPTMWQAEAFSPQTGYTRQEISFGGPDPTTGNPYNVLKTVGTQNTQYGGAPCLSGTAPSVPAPGRYVMMVRLITDSLAATAPSFRWGITAYGSGTMLSGMWRTWKKPAKGSGYAGWLALDAFQLPTGIDPTGLDIADTAAPILTLWHQGDGTSANVYIDKVMLVPAELVEGSAHNTQILAPNDYYGAAENSILRVDDQGLRVGITTRDTPPKWFSVAPPKLGGGFPYVTPGLDNWLTFVPNTDTAGYTDDLVADEFDVTVSYHPRYLHLASA